MTRKKMGVSQILRRISTHISGHKIKILTKTTIEQSRKDKSETI